MGENFLLIVLVILAGLFEQPNGGERKTAKNGWKLSKVEKIGSIRSFFANNG